MSFPGQIRLLAYSVIVSFVLTACGKAAAPPPTTGPKITASGFECPEPEYPVVVASTELNIFVWTEYISQDMKECFELVYGIKVNQDEYSSNDDLFKKISQGGSDYDLIQPTDYIVKPMAKQNLLQELDHRRLPVLKNFDSNYLDFEFDPGNKYTIPYLVGTNSIVVNTRAVNTIPQSWADLWNPEYAGRMVFLEESRSVIGLTLLTLGYDANSTNPDELDKARSKLSQLVPNIRIFDSDSPKTALLARQVALGLTWSGEAFLANQQNPDIKYIYPTEGTILWQDNWAMLANAKHVDAAYAWLNYTNQGDVFWMLLRDWPYTNPNKAALEYAKNNSMKVLDWNGKETTLDTLYDTYMASPITNVPQSIIRAGHRISDVGDIQPLYDQIWAEVTGR